MKINAALSRMKSGAVGKLALGLAPGGEPLSAPLARLLDKLWGDVDAILAVGGEGSFRVELVALSDEDVRRLALRWFALEQALDRRRDAPFLALVAQLRVGVANEGILRDLSAGRLLLVDGGELEMLE